ncbi:hypothetical protein [Alicycliphilus denitrificans]|uniref:hypothetical protein n=1 Tax=Alicycliphilus denitrificans TaxID=179636 RepID=UPI00384D0A29
MSFSALSQSNILLEACNKIENQSDRLACFKEIYTTTTKTITATDKQEIAINSIKREFAELQQIIRTGISYNTYSEAIIKPAMKLGALKLELNGEMPYMVNSLEDAVIAYNDAKTVWHASIYDSMDGGIFAGKILNPERSGLLEIVKKYNLPLESKLLNPRLPAMAAVLKIFDYAENKTKDAFTTAASPMEHTSNNKVNIDPFRPISPVNDKCKDKFSILYDPLVCKND